MSSPKKPLAGCHSLPQMAVMGTNVRTAQAKPSPKLVTETAKPSEVTKPSDANNSTDGNKLDDASKLSEATVIEPESSLKFVKINDNVVETFEEEIPKETAVQEDENTSGLNERTPRSVKKSRKILENEGSDLTSPSEKAKEPKKSQTPKSNKKRLSKTVDPNQRSMLDFVRKDNIEKSNDGSITQASGDNNEKLGIMASQEDNETKPTEEAVSNSQDVLQEEALYVHIPRCVIIKASEVPKDDTLEKWMGQTSVSYDQHHPPNYEEGDLLWAKVSGHPYWPCMVSLCPFSKMFSRISGDYKIVRIFHVQFFGDEVERGWISEPSLKVYGGKERFLGQASVELAKMKNKTAYSPYRIKPNRQVAWNLAVEEAEGSVHLTREERKKQYTFDYVYMEDLRKLKKTEAKQEKEVARQEKEAVKVATKKVKTPSKPSDFKKMKLDLPLPGPKKRKREDEEDKEKEVSPPKAKRKKIEPVKPPTIEEGSFDEYYAIHHTSILEQFPDWDLQQVYDHMKASWDRMFASTSSKLKAKKEAKEAKKAQKESPKLSSAKKHGSLKMKHLMGSIFPESSPSESPKRGRKPSAKLLQLITGDDLPVSQENLKEHCLTDKTSHEAIDKLQELPNEETPNSEPKRANPKKMMSQTQLSLPTNPDLPSQSQEEDMEVDYLNNNGPITQEPIEKTIKPVHQKSPGSPKKAEKKVTQKLESPKKVFSKKKEEQSAPMHHMMESIFPETKVSGESAKRGKKPSSKLIEMMTGEAMPINQEKDKKEPPEKLKKKAKEDNPQTNLPSTAANTSPKVPETPKTEPKKNKPKKSVEEIAQAAATPEIKSEKNDIEALLPAESASATVNRKASQDSDSSVEKGKGLREQEEYELEIFKLSSTCKVDTESICAICLKWEDPLVECTGTCLQSFCFTCAGVTNNTTATFKCAECTSGIHTCFLTKKASADNKKCSVASCGKYYNFEAVKEHRLTRLDAKGFICPLHTCTTCTVDNSKNPKATKGKLYKCVRCPTAYHTGDMCIAAGSIILAGYNILCSNHFESKKKNSQSKVHITWCMICGKGGSLICCESCPASFHAECANADSPVPEKWYCMDCECGGKPLYGQIIWMKVGNYRWWPGEVCHPRNVPTNIQRMAHSVGEFPVRFFGSHDYYWLHQGRVFAFQEGDTASRCGNAGKHLAKVYNKGVEEATEAFRIWTEEKSKAEKLEMEKTDKKPAPYKSIRVNYPIGNVTILKADIGELPCCECDQRTQEEFPCEDNCLNKMMLFECHPALCGAKEKCCNQRFQRRQYPDMKPFKVGDRGWGLQCNEEIKKGQFVAEYVGDLIDEEEAKMRLEQAHKDNISNFYMLTLDKNRIIDAGPKGNLSRFMNHSCNPNLETQKWMVAGDIRVGLFALRDIDKGEELTFNYNLEARGNEKKQCICGSDNCSGYLGVRPKTAAAIANEKKSEQSKLEKKKKRKKKKINMVKEHEDECFRCELGGELVMCDKLNCPKVYHLACLKLTAPPMGKWLCPWHHCDECGKVATSKCAECPNSFCAVHAPGSIFMVNGALICDDHEDLIKGMLETSELPVNGSHIPDPATLAFHHDLDESDSYSSEFTSVTHSTTNSNAPSTNGAVDSDSIDNMNEQILKKKVANRKSGQLPVMNQKRRSKQGGSKSGKAVDSEDQADGSSLVIDMQKDSLFN